MGLPHIASYWDAGCAGWAQLRVGRADSQGPYEEGRGTQSCAHTPGSTAAHRAVPSWSARYAELIGLKEIAGSLITEPIERHVSA